MNRIVSLGLLILFPFVIYADFSNAQYIIDLVMEYGAIDAGAAGAFSATDYSNFSIDHNPALLVFGDKFSYNNSHYVFDVVVPLKFYYNSVSVNFNKFACGLGYHNRKYSGFPAQSYSIGLGSRLNKNSTIGITLKYIHSQLSTVEAKNLCVGLGYYWYNQFEKLTYSNNDILKGNNVIINYFGNNNQNYNRGLSFGFSLRNIGPHVSFIDVDQADPLPQEINLGITYSPVITNLISIKIGCNLKKDLVTSFPKRDIDGNGVIGGYDKNGNKDVAGEYSSNGKIEFAHRDKWYRSLITSWADDWFLLYDSKVDGIGENDKDGDLTDGSFNKEIKTIANHLGIEISLIGWLGVRCGKIMRQFNSRDVNSWGYYLGPDFLRYHYSNYKWNYIGSDYQYNIDFHTIEFTYTTNFLNIITKIF